VEPSLILGSVDADHLSITLVARAHPEATDYWDGNWVRSLLEVRAGGFRAHVIANLRADEIHRFAHGLQSMSDNLAGATVLQSMEEWITLSITCNPNGTLDILGEVTDQPGVGNRLSFELHGFDQTHMSSWVAQLAAVESRFPVIGDP
jgi:hypothetical protein